jgi:hypothetical protein
MMSFFRFQLKPYSFSVFFFCVFAGLSLFRAVLISLLNSAGVFFCPRIMISAIYYNINPQSAMLSTVTHSSIWEKI